MKQKSEMKKQGVLKYDIFLTLDKNKTLDKKDLSLRQNRK